MAKVYTKTGDKGETSLVSGTRISKGSERIQLYGDLDELNSHIGFLHSFLEDKEILNLGQKIQSALFDLGSNLACEELMREKFKLPQVSLSIIKELETAIDMMDKELEPLKNFVLPGGSQAAAYSHVCRTVCRRVEVELVRFVELSKESAPENALIFLNRLSDYYFILGRYLNKKNKSPEILWKPAIS